MKTELNRIPFLKNMIIVFFIGLLTFSKANAQLQIDTSRTAAELIDDMLVGNGIRVGNITVKGHRLGIGSFTIDTALFGMRSGILLSSGSVFAASGPNNQPSKTGNTLIRKKKSHSDRDLNKLCKGKTYDAVVIEFDFIPFENKVSFNYCFASEEYKEFVNTSFNDVFGFFISGNGFKKTNVALIPGTDMAVSINNVNQGENKEFFIDNDPFMNFQSKGKGKVKPKYNRIKQFFFKLSHRKEIKKQGYAVDKNRMKDLDTMKLNRIQYDGMTVKMTMVVHVIPYKKYHMKIAIADVADGILDSGVFLEAGSFTAVKDSTIKGFTEYADRRKEFNSDSALNLLKPTTTPTVDEDEDKDAIQDEFRITDILFTSDSYIISDSALLDLDRLATYLLQNKKIHCQLTGFTDAQGNDKHNRQLSERRAKAVMDYLEKKGIEKSRLQFTGHSSEDPVGNNATEAGRALNRRVEIELFSNE